MIPKLCPESPRLCTDAAPRICCCTRFQRYWQRRCVVCSDRRQDRCDDCHRLTGRECSGQRFPRWLGANSCPVCMIQREAVTTAVEGADEATDAASGCGWAAYKCQRQFNHYMRTCIKPCCRIVQFYFAKTVAGVLLLDHSLSLECWLLCSPAGRGGAARWHDTVVIEGNTAVAPRCSVGQLPTFATRRRSVPEEGARGHSTCVLECYWLEARAVQPLPSHLTAALGGRCCC